MSGYEHGVTTSEQPTSIIPPRRMSAGVPVVFGTAPVHMVRSGYVGPVNQAYLASTYPEAVMAAGYSEEWGKYTLSEFFKGFFGLFNVAPMIFVNVFDPATHKSSVTDETVEINTDGQAQLANKGLVGTPVVKKDTTVMTAGTDYVLDTILGLVTILEGGALANGETLKVTYDYGDPSKVTSADIIGGIDAATGKQTGLELVDQVFPRFRLVPGVVVAPGWSHDPAVAAFMHAKSGNINAHFKGLAIADIYDDTVVKYSDVPGWKNTKNLVDEQLLACWPKVKLGDAEYWLSTQAAGVIARTDAEHEDVPYKSPSNENLQMTEAVNNGEEVWIGPGEAKYLNGNGIITPLNWVGGWKLWGNRTACYPGVTDVKDSFIPIRRMFNWIANELILTMWQKVDDPTNRRLIETVVDSYNIRLNGLASRQFILGGRVEFNQEENPTTDVMDGKILFHVYLTPPSPAKEIGFLLEYDPAYLNSLFA